MQMCISNSVMSVSWLSQDIGTDWCFCLTHSFPMLPFSSPWKQKTCALGANGLNTSCICKLCNWIKYWSELKITNKFYLTELPNIGLTIFTGILHECSRTAQGEYFSSQPLNLSLSHFFFSELSSCKYLSNGDKVPFADTFCVASFTRWYISSSSTQFFPQVQFAAGSSVDSPIKVDIYKANISICTVMFIIRWCWFSTM